MQSEEESRGQEQEQEQEQEHRGREACDALDRQSDSNCEDEHGLDQDQMSTTQHDNELYNLPILPHYQTYLDGRQNPPQRQCDAFHSWPACSQMPLSLSTLPPPRSYSIREARQTQQPCTQNKQRVYYYQTPAQCHGQQCTICGRSLTSRNAIYVYCKALFRPEKDQQNMYTSTRTGPDVKSRRPARRELSSPTLNPIRPGQEKVKLDDENENKQKKRVSVCSTCAA